MSLVVLAVPHPFPVNTIASCAQQLEVQVLVSGPVVRKIGMKRRFPRVLLFLFLVQGMESAPPARAVMPHPMLAFADDLSDDDDALQDAIAMSSVALSASVAPPAVDWPCPACTYLNAAGRSMCEMCQTAAPVSPTSLGRSEPRAAPAATAATAATAAPSAASAAEAVRAPSATTGSSATAAATWFQDDDSDSELHHGNSSAGFRVASHAPLPSGTTGTGNAAPSSTSPAPGSAVPDLMP